ncbi:alkyl hydroperoxide reductase [Longibacter salinarum]|uniref:Alkyl hydroperoxide reductase n=1 Tax=Longibacter salinarum TaxID=1850348 RepID=A0A2A8CUC7_9BACT|nr:TlpA disulfide reductase family protein [Longibacter salinarum]PEN11445.1 alkyl hydroperoxide reductase [Longibacter salinarum]
MSIWSTQYVRIIALTAVVVLIGGVYVFLPDSAPDRSSSESESPPVTSTRASGANGSQHPLQSQKAPDFALERMNGETFRLSEHRGEVVVVNFWATWCPPCRMEIPGFIKLQKEFRDQGLTFVGISLDKGGFGAVRPYAEEMAINYPLVMGESSVVQKYGGVRGLPTTFVIDAEGDIAFARPGYLPEKQLRARLKPLLNEASSAGS